MHYTCSFVVRPMTCPNVYPHIDITKYGLYTPFEITVSLTVSFLSMTELTQHHICLWKDFIPMLGPQSL